MPADRDLDFKARVCCPARAHGLLFGHLFLIEDGVEDWEVDPAWSRHRVPGAER